MPDNWLRALPVNPDSALRLAQFSLHSSDSARSHLSAAERELIAVVSCSNHTRACGAYALDHHPVRLSTREQVLADVAEKLTTRPTNVGPDEQFFDR